MPRGEYLITDLDTITNKREIADTLATSFLLLSHHQHVIKNNSEGLYGLGKEKMTKSKMLYFQNEILSNLSHRQLVWQLVLTTFIHYQFLTLLPAVLIELLLLLLNNLWQSQYFPDKGREATIIPVRQLGKDQTNPNNYSPIALSSCLRKIMVRIINHRFTWFLQWTPLLLLNIKVVSRKYRIPFGQADDYIRQGFSKINIQL